MGPPDAAPDAAHRPLGRSGVLLWGLDMDQESPGFVWVEDGRVVGNISFRRAATAGGWMIGNVAVHPPVAGPLHRSGAGGGRAGRHRRAAAHGWGWRSGRTTRRPATSTRGWALRRSGRRWKWPATEGRPWPRPGRRTFRCGGRAAESHDLYYLAREGLARTHQEVLEIRPSAYRAGWEARLSAWLEGRREDWWVLRNGPGTSPSGALRLTSYRPGRWHEVEVLVRPEQIDELGGPLVAAALAFLARRPAWETITALPGVRMRLEPLFTNAGFHPLRRLLQMRRMLGTTVHITQRHKGTETQRD